MVMDDSIVDIYGHDRSIVATHGHGLYYCGYLLACPLLLWILMGMFFTILPTHGNGRLYCGYSW